MSDVSNARMCSWKFCRQHIPQVSSRLKSQTLRCCLCMLPTSAAIVAPNFKWLHTASNPTDDRTASRLEKHNSKHKTIMTHATCPSSRHAIIHFGIVWKCKLKQTKCMTTYCGQNSKIRHNTNDNANNNDSNANNTNNNNNSATFLRHR